MSELSRCALDQPVERSEPDLSVACRREVAPGVAQRLALARRLLAPEIVLHEHEQRAQPLQRLARLVHRRCQRDRRARAFELLDRELELSERHALEPCRETLAREQPEVALALAPRA